MILILGVGNTLLSDDGAGCSVADAIAVSASSASSASSTSSPGLIAWNGGTAPENFTAPIRRASPALLIIVDAARMGLPPGSIRSIPPEKIDDTSIGTHMLPLSHLINYLSPDIPDILFIGIEPKTIEPGEGLSEVVQKAAEQLIWMIKKKDLASIQRL
ncbi:MAG: hydrogenase 3 maturation endopeptidase HyCI [Methanocalculus sp. MSAO_Arc1]|nr:MAG: hydrogenase 3 maturation endopeptidase HyCI [Methanocalculus sp. MSAO_Arc1]